MTNAGPVLVVRDLTKRYGDFTALDSVSFSVDRGRILGLIGPNGAGKTTAIKILVGLSLPTSGQAQIAGVDCARDSKSIKRLVGYMPDRFGAFNNMRVREYLDFFGAAYGIGRRKRGKRIAEVLETTNSTYMQDRFVDALSHGMQQRIGIARTLLHDPEVLIFDEPANGLDPQARIEMRQMLLHLADMNKTLLVTSHILPELSRICHQVAIVTEGKLRAFGTLAEIMRSISQKRTYEVQLSDAENIDRTAAIVKKAIGDDGSVQPSVAEAMVRFHTTKSEQELGGVLTELVAADVGVTQFRELQTNLEDAFLSVTQSVAANNGDSADQKRDSDAMAAPGVAS